MNDGRKWMAVAMVVSAIILYMGTTKSYRDCVTGSMENRILGKEPDRNIVMMTCHMKR